VVQVRSASGPAGHLSACERQAAPPGELDHLRKAAAWTPGKPSGFDPGARGILMASGDVFQE